MNLYIFLLFCFIFQNNTIADDNNDQQCSVDNKDTCEDEKNKNTLENTRHKYDKESNEIYERILSAVDSFKSCTEDVEDPKCQCHAGVIKKDLEPFKNKGITRELIENSKKYGTHYKILNHRLYRDQNCMFPTRCSGIEHFLLNLLPNLPNMDLVINTRDWPQHRAGFGAKYVVFSFSKTNEYFDIMYPAWTFWEGGPAISLYPTGIGRWDLLRESLSKAAENISWSDKQSRGLFRGSRTSNERDSLVLLSRRKPELVNAQYTKNQAWKSPKDTLHAEPAPEISFEEHCRYKYLFNFRGIAASFRFKHLFLCKSLVFHVGNEWDEFFYPSLKPWIHYVPLNSYPSEEEIEKILLFFRAHDNLAKEIADRGFQFIWNHLRMKDIECYWNKLLLKYKKLLKYEIEEEEELIEIKHKQKDVQQNR